MPVMKSSPLEIDRLLQDYMTASGFYQVEVFEFTEEQVQSLLIRKLQGY
jgi:hypothetical protein